MHTNSSEQLSTQKTRHTVRTTCATWHTGFSRARLLHVHRTFEVHNLHAGCSIQLEWALRKHHSSNFSWRTTKRFHKFYHCLTLLKSFKSLCRNLQFVCDSVMSLWLMFNFRSLWYQPVELFHWTKRISLLKYLARTPTQWKASLFKPTSYTSHIYKMLQPDSVITSHVCSRDLAQLVYWYLALNMSQWDMWWEQSSQNNWKAVRMRFATSTS